FMRVYWSGALYFLEADLALRALPDALTLDDVIRSYDECCLKDGDERPAIQTARDFDRLAGVDLFVPLFRRYAESREIPAYNELLESAEFSRLLTGNARPRY
ncbi:MAG: hypothetical protein KJP03_00360, partial [Gammaproteobacteria bacterium]|nr:hypothetical protein [Gammaproteobacteria bacterium]